MKFNAVEHTNKIIEFIRNYYQENNLGGVVIGISGGKDSGVVAGLFSKAIGPENVIGVTLPCHSKKIDSTDAKLVADHFGFKLINLDLTKNLDKITRPTLLIWGTEDKDTPISDAKKMEKLIPDCGLIEYPGATHFSYLETEKKGLLQVRKKFAFAADVISSRPSSRLTSTSMPSR